MPIPSYLVFGIIHDSNDVAINNISVYAIDNSTSSIINSVTDSDGVYNIDLSNLTTVNDGNSITITCNTYGLSYSECGGYTFTLDLDEPFPRVDLDLHKQNIDIIGDGQLTMYGNNIMILD